MPGYRKASFGTSISNNNNRREKTSASRRVTALLMENPSSNDCTIAMSGPEDSLQSNAENANITNEVWYFGYGPIVNPAVRERRGVETSEHRAALLPEHRLTFAYGGVANIVPARGFTVQGILMKVNTPQDWEKLKQFDAGQYEPQLLQVFPYDSIDHSVDDPVEAFDETQATIAHVFVMCDFDEERLAKPIEKKPQERYLKLITQGMLRHGADREYVNDEIMACPYIPSRPPENWYSFSQKTDRLPSITLEKYQKLCRKAQSTEFYFCLHQDVFKADPHDPTNPSSQWMQCHAHGKTDISFLVHTMIVDPDLPFCGTAEQMTVQHYLWAENHIFEFLQQAGITAHKVYRLKGGGETSTANGYKSGGSDDEGEGGGARRQRGSWRQSLRQSLTRNRNNNNNKPS